MLFTTQCKTQILNSFLWMAQWLFSAPDLIILAQQWKIKYRVQLVISTNLCERDSKSIPWIYITVVLTTLSKTEWTHLLATYKRTNTKPLHLFLTNLQSRRLQSYKYRAAVGSYSFVRHSIMVAINPVNANIMFHFYLYLCYFLFSIAFVIWNFEFLSHQGQIHKSFHYIMYVKCRYVTKKPNQTPLYVICIAYLSEACAAATLTEQWYSC